MKTEFKVDKKDGITKAFLTAKQICEGCGVAIKPIFKAGRTPEDWFWFTCDTCDKVFCEKCAEDDGSGKVTCNDCYQTECWRKTQ